MSIKVSKWGASVPGASIRYYVNNLDAPAGTQIWISFNDPSKPIAGSKPNINIKLHDVLDQLLNAGLINADEHKMPNSALFDRLASTKNRAYVPTKFKPASQLPVQQEEENSTAVPAIVLDKPVMIIVDTNEPSDIVKAFSKIEAVKIKRKKLLVGDFSFQGGIVERKSAYDLSQSVIDKRIFFQSDAMAEAPSKVLKAVIIEGNPYKSSRISMNALDGAISYLAVLQGLTVLYSMNPQHTANLVAKMAYHAAHGLGYELSYREAKPKNIDDQIMFILQGVPGIGVEMASLLLKHFGSLSKIFNAEPKELMAVNGIGKKMSEGIVNVINKVWKIE